MRQLLRRLKFLFRRGRFERDLEEELRYHADRLAEDRAGQGAAGRRFGNVARVREESRRMWITTVGEQLTQDVRYGVRALAANPLFTAMAILSLALGIGANTAIYSFLDGILLRDLPVARPAELVVLNWRAADSPKVIHRLSGSQYRDGKHGVASPNYPFAFYQDLQEKQNSLSSLFAYAPAWELNIVTRYRADIAEGELVSGGFFRGLGVVPAAGRLILDEDDRPGAPPVAVLSYKYWSSRYPTGVDAVGQSIRINHIPVTVVGVAPPGFFGVNPGTSPAVYLPMRSAPVFSPKPADEEQSKFIARDSYWVEMMGRLRPGVSLEQAQAELAGRFQQFVKSTITSPKEKENLPALWLQRGGGGLDSLRRQYAEPLYILMAMVGLILAIACANIANLLLARATARRREMAIRLSLGASRGRVVGQLLTESVMLSLAGAALGLLVALWGIRSITWLLSNGQEGFTLHATLSWPVLAFAFVLALATGVLFGLAPALRATGVDLTSGLKETKAGSSGRQARHFGLGQALLTAQVAVSLVLVVAAGLFVRTISNLHSVDLGFNRENILIFYMNARQSGYEGPTLAKVYGDLLDRFGRIPGVRGASLSKSPLAIGSWNSTEVTIPGAPAVEGRRDTCVEPVDPSFLATLQIPMLAGRGFNRHDMQSPRVAIVSEQFVKKFFPKENPLGRRIGIGGNKTADIEIVGIARTTRYNSIKETETPPVAYVPYTQDLDDLGRSGVFFELRTAGDPLLALNTVRQIVRQQNASIAISYTNTLAAQIDLTIGKELTFAQLCTCFAVLALIIACVGLYGTISYTVARRTSEIGIRMALGAERRRILWMVLREVLSIAGVGLAIGLAAAWGATRFVESFLFGLKHNDPAVLAVSVVVLAGAALAAGYAPARRAARVDPMAALRHE